MHEAQSDPGIFRTRHASKALKHGFYREQIRKQVESLLLVGKVVAEGIRSNLPSDEIRGTITQIGQRQLVAATGFARGICQRTVDSTMVEL